MKKVTVHRSFDLEKNGLIFCSHCHWRGKFIHDALEAGVRKVCGRFGLTKKGEQKDGSCDDFVLAHGISVP